MIVDLLELRVADTVYFRCNGQATILALETDERHVWVKFDHSADVGFYVGFYLDGKIVSGISIFDIVRIDPAQLSADERLAKARGLAEDLRSYIVSGMTVDYAVSAYNKLMAVLDPPGARMPDGLSDALARSLYEDMNALLDIPAALEPEAAPNIPAGLTEWMRFLISGASPVSVVPVGTLLALLNEVLAWRSKDDASRDAESEPNFDLQDACDAARAATDKAFGG